MALTTALVAGSLATSYMDNKSRSDANKQQRADTNAANQFAIQQGQQAQNYLSGALPQMQGQINRGYQSAANLLGGLIPQQIGALNQGNAQAQGYLLNSLPLYQQAIMGMPLNLGQIASQVQPSQISYDPNFLNQPLPNPFQGV